MLYQHLAVLYQFQLYEVFKVSKLEVFKVSKLVPYHHLVVFQSDGCIHCQPQ